jgi:hypothetical protein
VAAHLLRQRVNVHPAIRAPAGEIVVVAFILKTLRLRFLDNLFILNNIYPYLILTFQDLSN